MTHLKGNQEPNPLKIIRSNGSRDQKGINEQEAHDVIAEIQRITQQQKNIDPSHVQSIGILSPFRDQVDFLAKKIIDSIDQYFVEKHDITCGTAYSFQGEERDVMLISCGVDDSAHHSAIIHLNKPEVFNVMVTRARVHQAIFISFSDQFDCGKFLRRYLNDAIREEGRGFLLSIIER